MRIWFAGSACVLKESCNEDDLLSEDHLVFLIQGYIWCKYKCQDKYAQKFSYKYVQFILLSILSRFLGKGAEADKIFLLL